MVVRFDLGGSRERQLHEEDGGLCSFWAGWFAGGAGPEQVSEVIRST